MNTYMLPLDHGFSQWFVLGFTIIIGVIVVMINKRNINQGKKGIGRGSIICLSLSLLLPNLLVAWFDWGDPRVVVNDAEIVVSGPMISSETILLRDLVTVEMVNLSARPDLLPKIRIFGASIGDYRQGYFRLNDGRKAIFFTDNDAVFHIQAKQVDVFLPGPMSHALQDNILSLVRPKSSEAAF